MNIIKTYLVACRSYVTSTIFNGFLMGSITSMVHTGSLDFTKSIIVYIVCFQTHNFMYLVNSLIDFLNQVDDKETAVDRTLFDVITVDQLKGYLKFILFSILSLLTLTFYWYGYQELLTFFSLAIFQLLCGLTYTQSKYVGLGYLPFISYHVSVYWFFYYSHSGFLPLIGPPFYYSFLTAFGIGISLSGNYVRDYDDDKKAGIITLATYFGKNTAIQIIKFVILLNALFVVFIAFLFENYYLILSVFPLYPIIGLYNRAKNEKIPMLNMRVGYWYVGFSIIFFVSIILKGQRI